ncbi:MAG TPA: hypothetical protein VHS96_14730, partial [Bacteroidia bacterium]|nr:hypothetical protein [Bacteroidia bacterium]
MKNQGSPSSTGSFLRLLAVALLGGIFTLGGYKLLETKFSGTGEHAFTDSSLPSRFASISGAPSGLNDFTVAAELSTPAVVHVKSNVMVQTRNMFGMDPFGGM